MVRVTGLEPIYHKIKTQNLKLLCVKQLRGKAFLMFIIQFVFFVFSSIFAPLFKNNDYFIQNNESFGELYVMIILSFWCF